MKTTIPLASGKQSHKLEDIHSLEDYLASAEAAGVQQGTEKLEKHHSEHKISQEKYLLYNSVYMELIRRKPSFWGQRSEWQCVLTVNRKELSGVTEQCASLSRCCVHNTLTPKGPCVCKSHDFCITTSFKVMEPILWISHGLTTLVKIALHSGRNLTGGVFEPFFSDYIRYLCAYPQ